MSGVFACAHSFGGRRISTVVNCAHRTSGDRLLHASFGKFSIPAALKICGRSLTGAHAVHHRHADDSTVNVLAHIGCGCGDACCTGFAFHHSNCSTFSTNGG